LLTANDRYTWCLVKQNQSVAMLTPNYFLYFVFSSKIHKRWLTLSEISNKLLKQQKRLHFLFSYQLNYRICVETGTKLTGIAKLCPSSYCVTPYQAFEAEGSEQDLSRNKVKGTL